MPSILEYREPYKVNGSFEYPEFFERFKKARLSGWTPDEVIFDGDIRDWQQGAEDEREIIGGILRGFTQLECHVKDYWTKVQDWFPKHEVSAVASEYAASEAVHAWSYNFLSENLGLDEFEAFLGDPVARQKIGYFLEEKSIKESLAIFSGAAEGVSLFSSFAVLLSLGLRGRYKGLSQIISWSALDEQQHSNTGIALFRELVKEQPLTSEESSTIINGFKQVIINEFAFIDKIFLNRSLGDKVTPHKLKNYILMRANNRLGKLGISGFRFPFDYRAASEIKEWFHPLISGNTSTDFFSQSKDGGNYISKPNQDFMAVNLKTLNFDLV